MNAFRHLCALLLVLPLCSCSTVRHAGNGLPKDLRISLDAARRGEVIVAVKLESGEEFPFAIDTGSPVTVFDVSLESKLGRRISSGTITVFDVEQSSDVYPAPKLFLGGAHLTNAHDKVVTCDFSEISAQAGRPIMGLIGLDTLEQYRVQMDFQKGRLRFLKPDQIDPPVLGKAFPLIFSSEGQSSDDCFRPFIERESLIGGAGRHLMIDTGCNIDGGLEPAIFHREAELQKAEPTKSGNARFYSTVWDGSRYTNILLRTWVTNVELPNIMGLNFLARHLVTFDFPNRILYLKQTSVGPLPEEEMLKEVKSKARTMAEVTQKLLKRLKKSGELPGWTRMDDVAGKNVNFHYHYPDSVTFDVRKRADMAMYHFEVTRASEDAHWKLSKAWRTDDAGATTANYPVQR